MKNDQNYRWTHWAISQIICCLGAKGAYFFHNNGIEMALKIQVSENHYKLETKLCVTCGGFESWMHHF